MNNKIIQGFKLIRLIGKGGMADVYYAENNLNRPAAIKILHSSLSAQPEVKLRFENEAQIMITLDHPNIRKVYDVGKVNGQPAIILEYLEGHTLSEALSLKLIEPSILPDLFNQAVAGLQYAHLKGIVHRDIKPSNLFLTTGGQLKILDFGIAKVEEASSHTLTGQTLGTILYMSPEQVQDPKRVDFRTDIYSLGVTFYHLVTCKPPYDNTTDSIFKIQTKIVREDLELKLLPKEWQTILKSALEKNPNNRILHDYFGDSTLSFTQNIPILKKQAGSTNIYGKKIRYKMLFLLIPVFVFIAILSLISKNLFKSELNPIVAQLENNMILVKGGSFIMGCRGEQMENCDEDEYPAHQVELESFWINKYEVTQEEWFVIMNKYHESAKNLRENQKRDCTQCPVYDVLAKDRNIFLSRLNEMTGKNYRLPTEAEWEFAARGGNNSKSYRFSGSNEANAVANFRQNLSFWGPTEVGIRISNELGLYDMSGNVYEWCSDFYDEGYYSFSSLKNPNGPVTGDRYLVARGGAFHEQEKEMRVSNRVPGNGHGWDYAVGFRLALSK